MGVIKRDRLAVAAHGCNTHTQRAEVQAARSRRDEFASQESPGGGAVTPYPAARRRRDSQAVGRPRWSATAEGF